MYPSSETLAARPVGNSAMTQSGSEGTFQSSGVRGDDGYHGIRVMIWIYFLLVIFEGSLRKWVFPGAATALLLVRDPVVAVCYFIALRNGKFPSGTFVISALLLGIMSTLASLVSNELADVQKLLMITAFGFHANFFHLPMIFLIRDAFDKERLRAIGKWVLILAPLAAVLIFLQYRSGPDAWVNRGAGKDSGQIWSGVSGSEKIRPASFFSYNTGNAAYLSWVAAFLLNALFIKRTIPKQLLIASAFALAIGGTLSISRTCVLSIVLVFGAGTLCTFLAPKLSARSVLISFLMGCLYLVASRFSVLGEGVAILQARVEESGGLHEGGVMRFLAGFVEPFYVLERAKFLGAGLGMGTNAAGGILTGQRTFALDTENEWARHFLESGALLGGAFIVWRIVLFVRLFRVSLAAVKSLNPLPMLLFATCFLTVLTGPIGIPMTLGFFVMGAGMTLAAAKEGGPETPEGPMIMETPKRAVVRGRSAYAEQLHSKQAG